MWHGIDKLAERNYSISPYVYCNNNPINQIDVDGRSYKTYMQEHYGTSGFRGASSFLPYLRGDYDGGKTMGGGGNSSFPKIGMGIVDPDPFERNHFVGDDGGIYRKDDLINDVQLTFIAKTGAFWVNPNFTVDKLSLGRIAPQDGGFVGVSEGGVGTAYDVFYGGFEFNRVCEFGGDVNFFSAYWQYKFGEGTDYHVDISKIDWSMLSEKNFPGGVGSIRQINIFSIKPISTAGLVFGDIRLQYIGSNQIKVANSDVKGNPYYDTYNYNVRWNEVMNGQNLIRNTATAFGWIGVNMPWHPLLFNTYGGVKYKFIFYGTGTIGGGR